VYGVVILNRPRTALKFLRTLDSKHLDFFVDYVKTICLGRGISVQHAVHILSRCTGIVNLACWIIPDSYSTAVLAPIISRLGLRRLSLNQKALPGLDQYQPRDCTLAFRSITHLDIVNHWALWSTSGLAALPRLTHIAFRYWACGSVAIALRNILSGCTALQVLVLLTHNLIMNAALELLDHESLDDPRVVVMSYSKDMQHWETLVRGEPDLWAQAEEIVMAQRSRLSAVCLFSVHPSRLIKFSRIRTFTHLSLKESIDVCHMTHFVYLSIAA